MTQAVLHIAGLSHTYRSRSGEVEALRDISLDVSADGITAVVGPNGSGKSTLFSLLTGLQRVQRGTIRYSRDGFRIAAVFQSPSLDAELTVFENLWHYAMLFGTVLSRQTLPTGMLATFGLEDYLDRPVKELSGGYRRRAEIAKVLCIQPDLLVMDEPFTGLDASSREAVFAELSQVSSQQDLPVLMITHALDLASRCDRVVVMDEGSIAADGNPVDLLAPFGDSVVEVTGDGAEALAARLRSGVDAARVRFAAGTVLLLRSSLEDLLPQLDANTRAGLVIRERRPTLEDYMLLRAEMARPIEEALGVAA